MTAGRFIVFCGFAAVLVGCSYVEELTAPIFQGIGGKSLESADAPPPSPKPYPEQTPLAEPLPIEIIRQGKSIIVENRSVRAIQNGELWLNRQYGATLATIPIGRGQPIALSNFINKDGKAYPVAEFLYPDHDKPLVMGDLLIDGKMHKLIVRLVDDWRRP
jgi:hypothetical protein